MDSMTHTLSLYDITKDYVGAPVLSGITLSIQPGELVAIMGPSGSGKSTLLHCMSGVLVPSSGEVRFGAQNISAMNDKECSKVRLRDFGFVFQDGQLIPELTNAENVALPAMLNGVARGKAKARAAELLEQLGLAGMEDRRPAQISGGQAQRVAIARALAAKPAVIFADEPTGALDQATGHEVMQLLTSMARREGTTMVMVTHDVAVANWMDRRVEIRDGIIHDDRQLGGQ